MLYYLNNEYAEATVREHALAPVGPIGGAGHAYLRMSIYFRSFEIRLLYLMVKSLLYLEKLNISEIILSVTFDKL